MVFLEFIVLFAIALVANGFSALAGGGSGLLQLPALLALGLPFATALATHKVATVALGVGASARHLVGGTLRLPVVALMLLSGLPGVYLGAQLIVGASERAAEVALGLLTLALGLYSLSRSELGQTVKTLPPSHWRLPIAAIGLFIIGVLNGALSSGTGLFATMWLIVVLGFDYRLAVAHSMVVVGLAWNAGGAAALALVATIRWDWLPGLILGSLLGGYLGTHIGLTKGNRVIKIAFEVVTLAVAAWLLWP